MDLRLDPESQRFLKKVRRVLDDVPAATTAAQMEAALFPVGSVRAVHSHEYPDAMDERLGYTRRLAYRRIPTASGGPS